MAKSAKNLIEITLATMEKSDPIHICGSNEDTNQRTQLANARMEPRYYQSLEVVLLVYG
jgi:hypothetical protein